jgi:copper chaperone CopZ
MLGIRGRWGSRTAPANFVDLDGIFMISTSGRDVRDPRVEIPRWGICPGVRIAPVPGCEAAWQLERVERFTMPTSMYAVEGMVCESCMEAVLANVHSLSGVTVVAMDLVTGGRSPLIVTSGATLGADAVRHAVEHVGFGVLRPKGRPLADHGNSPATRDGDINPDREPRVPSIGGLSS